jgi:YVTN family beta-propeller protein
MKNFTNLLLLLFMSTSCVLSQSTNSKYKLVRKISLPGDNGWDYLSVDETSGRLFVSHGNTVQVVDTKEGKMIGEIPDQKGVHGIALATDFRKGYISNGRDSSVTIFELSTLKSIGKINVNAKNPDAILYDSFSHCVFTFNGGSSSATVIDVKTDKVINSIPLIGKPEFAVSDGSGKIYVNIEDKSKLCVINTSKMNVENEWSLSPGEEPSGLAFDKKQSILFSVCDNNKMVVMNSTNGKAITTLKIGSHVDGAAFDPGLKRAYSSNGDGTLTVVQEDEKGNFSVLENVVTERGARTIAVDPVTHHIFLPTADYEKQDASEGNKRPAVKPGTFRVLEFEPVN